MTQTALLGYAGSVRGICFIGVIIIKFNYIYGIRKKNR